MINPTTILYEKILVGPEHSQDGMSSQKIVLTSESNGHIVWFRSYSYTRPLAVLKSYKFPAIEFAVKLATEAEGRVVIIDEPQPDEDHGLLVCQNIADDLLAEFEGLAHA